MKVKDISLDLFYGEAKQFTNHGQPVYRQTQVFGFDSNGYCLNLVVVIVLDSVLFVVGE